MTTPPDPKPQNHQPRTIPAASPLRQICDRAIADNVQDGLQTSLTQMRRAARNRDAKALRHHRYQAQILLCEFYDITDINDPILRHCEDRLALYEAFAHHALFTIEATHAER